MISAISAGALPGPFHLNGTKAIGRGESITSSITMRTSARASEVNPNSIINKLNTRITLFIFSPLLYCKKNKLLNLHH